MSKKIVAFTLPPTRAAQPEENRDPAPAPIETSAKPHTGHVSDNWVLAAQAELRQSREAKAPPLAMGAGPALLDLSAKRSWFELVQLIGIFPYIATWHWMIQMAEATLESSRRR